MNLPFFQTLLLLISFMLVSAANCESLGAPPVLPADVHLLPRTDGRFAADLNVDTQNRDSVKNFYNTVFQAGENVAAGWNGSVAGCQPGATSQVWRDAVAQRVNFFRAMSGIPSSITFLDENNRKAQQAALMMSANGALSHTPPASWNCYSAEGAEAAGKSNLSLGNAGAAAVFSQMRDNGANNTFAGHRRWILYPQTRLMGAGDIPGENGKQASNSLWVFDGNYGATRPAVRDDFVAWPPKGYVPFQLIFPRWSFSYPGADFSAATVNVSKAGSSVAVGLEQPNNGYGENTLVFNPENRNTTAETSLPRPAQDTAYSVTIGNVLVGGVVRSFSYTVNVFDPNPESAGKISFSPAAPTVAVGQTVNVTISGGSSPYKISYRWQSGAQPVKVTFASGNTLALTGLADGSATITVTDSENFSVPFTVTVGGSAPPSNRNPTARFTATPLSGSAPLSVALDASASSDSDGAITDYAWRTSDGQTASGPQSSLRFTSAGSYTVTLTVTDNQGATDSTSQTVIVSGSQTGTASFDPSTNNLYLPDVAVGGTNYSSVTLRLKQFSLINIGSCQNSACTPQISKISYDATSRRLSMPWVTVASPCKTGGICSEPVTYSDVVVYIADMAVISIGGAY